MESSKWATYFKIVYGQQLPTEYPLSVYDAWSINAEAYLQAGLANETTHPIVDPQHVKEGDLYEGGWGGLAIYHGQWDAASNNSWVEISHAVYPTELEGMWVWRRRGSGIYANVGRTKVFPTPADPSKIHREAIAFLSAGCSKKPSSDWPQMESDVFGFCAREKGCLG